MITANGRIDEHFIGLYKWDNLIENSPSSSTRNMWLYEWGCFGKYKTMWIPLLPMNWNFEMQPVAFALAPITTDPQQIEEFTKLFPNPIRIEDLDYVYWALPRAISIKHYISDLTPLSNVTKQLLTNATHRSLANVLITAPMGFGKQIKNALTSLVPKKNKKQETTVSRLDEVAGVYIIEGTKINLETVNTIEVPTTIDYLGKLWESHDWAKQEIWTKLGLAYNPEKRERMIQDEMQAQNQTIRANRDFLTDSLKTQAEKYGEKVSHIADHIEYGSVESILNMTSAQIDKKRELEIGAFAKKGENNSETQ